LALATSGLSVIGLLILLRVHSSFGRSYSWDYGKILHAFPLFSKWQKSVAAQPELLQKMALLDNENLANLEFKTETIDFPRSSKRRCQCLKSLLNF